MDEIGVIKEMLPEVFMQRKEVINLIPDVKPYNAATLFRDVLFSSIEQELLEKHLSVGSRTSDELIFELFDGEEEWSELCYFHGSSDRFVITTIGAKLLIRLFKSGLIEQKKKSSPKDLGRLEDYANSLPELKAKSDRIKKEKEEEERRIACLFKTHEDRIKHLIKHPEDAKIEELNRAFLNKYACEMGLGNQAFKFAGARVVKDIRTLKSNTGKSAETYVSIQWTMPDGTRHGDSKSEPVLNRRNDPERNWGLGRE